MNRESNGDHTGVKGHILVLSKRMIKSPLDWRLLWVQLRLLALTAMSINYDHFIHNWREYPHFDKWGMNRLLKAR